MVSKEHILAEIRRTADENGGVAVGKQRFATETGIRESDWSGRYWSRWSDALVEAGYEPNTLNARLADDLVLSRFAEEVRRLGRMPTHAELGLRRRTDETFPSPNVFTRFGSKRALAARLLKVYPDLADLIGPLPTEEERTPDTQRPAHVEFGFVYLLRSGKHYKIGKSNSFGRRERELAIQLPERAQTVHVIRTDDPAGIERYWHQRFAERRGNGEWFVLTPEDVTAFRRRKFM